ncbi:unknown similar to AMEV204 [Adoxophyes honmai entomopoxvirus 'L']|uniref:Uncharacterized protein n=1 Tax=Adoxophyes honmai entomopoxvirus 'L' TaxID=1293540 RepID=A0A916KPK6_9POXV|nr:unknown similar to AMEV204 [Adoxophyes honmai entomopoxvirus 'L']CCU55465.1 unknown similar to AMEV204 [Adoxophyes honmai entomopoxvirus 'L']
MENKSNITILHSLLILEPEERKLLYEDMISTIYTKKINNNSNHWFIAVIIIIIIIIILILFFYRKKYKFIY